MVQPPIPFKSRGVPSSDSGLTDANHHTYERIAKSVFCLTTNPHGCLVLDYLLTITICRMYDQILSKVNINYKVDNWTGMTMESPRGI